MNIKNNIKKIFLQKQVEDLTKLDYLCSEYLLQLSLVNIGIMVAFLYCMFNGYFIGMFIFFGVGSIVVYYNRKGNIARDVIIKAGKFESKDIETKKKDYKKINLREKLTQGDFLN